jgi:microcompartment protein CcmK/EutM
MNCARVIGKTYSEFKHPSLKGYDFKILQVVDAETRELKGRPFFAIDPLGVALDEFVAFEESFQATWAFKDHHIPVDCAITAIIDSLYSGEEDR